MADIFVTEEYIDGTEDHVEAQSQSLEEETPADEKDEEQQKCAAQSQSLEEETPADEKDEEQQKCAVENSETVNEAENNTDMTLRQDEPEGDQFGVDGLLVNPDDLLPPVVKLEKYVDSDMPFNRQIVVRNILETLRTVQGNQGHIDRVINVICTLSDDYDHVVRSELMGQFPYIAAFFSENGLSSSVQEYLLPILVNNLGAENNQVRKGAHSALITILEQKLIDTEILIINEKICRMVVHLTDGIHPEDLRTDAVQLMRRLAVLGGEKVTKELFLERFYALCVDKANYIRKTCALIFGDICTTVGENITEEQLLPKFIELCKDTAWGVRKACTENFMAVSSVVSRGTRCKELTDIYLLLINDPSRWVRVSAYQFLGPFISTFAEPYKTGLLYEEGKLEIFDVDWLSNWSSLVPDEKTENSSNLDRTKTSEPCDNIVPLNSSEKSLSPSEIPGIPCHVGNYSTVIEVNCENTTDANDKTIENAIIDSQKNGSHSKEEELKKLITFHEDNNISSSSDFKDSGFINSIFKMRNKTTQNKKMKTQSLLMNGDCGDINDENFEKLQKILPSHNSVTVNGVCVDPDEEISEALNCESIPVISFFNKNKQFCYNNEINQRVDNMGLCKQNHSESIENSTFSIKTTDALSHTKTDSNLQSEENTDRTISNGNESAFNHFQYWRIPIPDIDTDFLSSDSSNSHEQSSSKQRRKVKLNNISLESDIQQQYNRHESMMDRKPNFDAYFNNFLNVIENKEGEPPPGQRNITAYDQDIVPPELLECYLNMIDLALTEVAHHCAYSLPAVAITLGRKYWPCLKDTFDALSSDLQGFIMMWKVRRTVASSMHQLAVILGPEITSKDLLPVFSRFINDLDEVRIGILQHLYEFLREIRPEERKQFLPSLSEFLVSNSDTESKEKNWRFRLILAEQLVSVADLYEPEDVKEHLVPLSLTLIQDKICEVRLAAVRVMAAVMKRMSQHPTPYLTKTVLSQLTEKFIHSPKWFHRQLYVYICQEFIVQNSLTPDQFAEDALPQLLYLCWDRVPNVRIAIARCLAVVIWPLETFSGPDSPHRELLLQTIHTLQSDIDADVQFYANMVSTHECSCLQHGEFTNLGELPV